MLPPTAVPGRRSQLLVALISLVNPCFLLLSDGLRSSGTVVQLLIDSESLLLGSRWAARTLCASLPPTQRGWMAGRTRPPSGKPVTEKPQL